MSQQEQPNSLESISQSCNDAESLLNKLELENNDQDNNEFIESTIASRGSRTEQINASDTQPNRGMLGFILITSTITVLILIAWKPWEKKYASQNEYRDAMQFAEDAVLISEHRQAIVQLNAVKAKGLNPSTMDNGLLNNRIIQAKKAIRYLDAEGKSKYTEKGNYGYQWYNIHDGNAYKVFFAHSRKCKSPMITFEYSDTKNGPTIKRKYVQPKATISTIRVPYLQRQGNQWLGIGNFRCN